MRPNLSLHTFAGVLAALGTSALIACGGDAKPDPNTAAGAATDTAPTTGAPATAPTDTAATPAATAAAATPPTGKKGKTGKKPAAGAASCGAGTCSSDKKNIF